MKRRRIERVERRRPLVELNLVVDSKPSRLNVPRTGCMSLLAPVLIGVIALALVDVGLR